MILKNGIIKFFYVDNIVFAQKKDRSNIVKQIVKSLQQKLTIKMVRKLKQFFSLHVIHNCSQRIIQLLQKAYITKICSKFTPTLSDAIQLTKTLMDITELLSFLDKKKVTDNSRTLYQQKIGSLLFVAIATRLNIAFIVFKLS